MTRDELIAELLKLPENSVFFLNVYQWGDFVYEPLSGIRKLDEDDRIESGITETETVPYVLYP